MERSVRVTSTSTVLPAIYRPETVPRRIDLTPWDLQFLLAGSIQKGILFCSPVPPNLIHLLKGSLSRTLDYFYPVAGCLASFEDVSKESTLFYIECNNAGVEFTHAVAEGVTVADILQPVSDSDIIRSLFSQNGLKNIECDTKPFLAVQVTQLADGGCFVGLTLSHTFADGSCFWHFFNSWSEICRGGSNSIKHLPVLERQYPGPSELWIPNSLLVRQSDHHQNLSIFKERIINFSKEKIAALKQKALEETGNSKISSLQATLAFIWRAVSRNRSYIKDHEHVHLIMGIGDRTRSDPPLPIHYLGTAMHPVVTTMKRGDIVAEGGLGRAARNLNNTVASQTSAVVFDFLRTWVKNPSLIPFGLDSMKNILGVSSSPWFDVYGNDFGWGRPVAVRSGAGHKLDGKLTFFAGAEQGSVDVEVCLLAETMEALERDADFIDAHGQV